MLCSVETATDFLWGGRRRQDVLSLNCFPCGFHSFVLGTHLLCAGLRHRLSPQGFLQWGGSLETSQKAKASVIDAKRGQPSRVNENSRVPRLKGRWWWRETLKGLSQRWLATQQPRPLIQPARAVGFQGRCWGTRLWSRIHHWPSLMTGGVAHSMGQTWISCPSLWHWLGTLASPEPYKMGFP